MQQNGAFTHTARTGHDHRALQLAVIRGLNLATHLGCFVQDDFAARPRLVPVWSSTSVHASAIARANERNTSRSLATIRWTIAQSTSRYSCTAIFRKPTARGDRDIDVAVLTRRVCGNGAVEDRKLYLRKPIHDGNKPVGDRFGSIVTHSKNPRLYEFGAVDHGSYFSNHVGSYFHTVFFSGSQYRVHPLRRKNQRGRHLLFRRGSELPESDSLALRAPLD